MKIVWLGVFIVLAGCQPAPVTTAAPASPQSAPSAAKGCAGDSVSVGPTCVDKYEASVWQIPASQTALIQKVRDGAVSLQDLTGGGAKQVGCKFEPFNQVEFPASFDATGNWTEPLYAVSIAGTFPSSCISWFQAEQACRLSNKRLLTNQEWQAAVSGTPDPGEADDGSTTCVTTADVPMLTGTRAKCVSKWGAFDMVGNLWEWVGDWNEMASGCEEWPERFGGDGTCFGGDGGSNFPSAVARGGSWNGKVGAGVFAISSNSEPSAAFSNLGFRCGR